ncbi:MAG: DNA-3-methyladenine glycosylase 2 family protein [Lewinellaceae bacterium]|nr:DNA-3-methyladenine glycosylase 2 family protein [Lewinellaceae bacterium]
MKEEAAILHLSKDDCLARLIQCTSVQSLLPSGKVYFELLESIVSQQLSVRAAATIFSRFCALFPDNYPAPEVLVAVKQEQLRAAGLSNQKANYLKNVAAFALENNLDKIPWQNYSDIEIINLLTQIKGVGRWTTEMILIFTLGRPDVFPIDDLGIQQGMIKLYGLPDTGKALRLRMQELSEPWQPYRSTASRYLWRWKDQIQEPID